MESILKLILLPVILLLVSCSAMTGVGKNAAVPGGGKVLKAHLTEWQPLSSIISTQFSNKNSSSENLLCSFSRKSPSSTSKAEVELASLDLVRGKKNGLIPELIFPVPGGVLSSPFGYRRGIFHSGLDITACKGDPIVACSDGRVVFTGSRKGYRSYGQTILIDHGRDVYTHYAHLSRILVRKGQKVRAGEKIGLVGSTGRSTSPHLHLEVKVGNKLFNPLDYFSRSELSRIEVAKGFSETPMGPVGLRRRLSSHP